MFEDANNLLEKIIRGNWLQPKGIIGLFPANSIGDDIEIYHPEQPTEVIHIQRTLRQQTKKAQGQPNIALADFIAPKESGIHDYIGGFAVTSGLGIEKYIQEFEANHDDYNSIMLKALADRFAEAFAEYLHEEVRKNYWGYASNEQLNNEELIKESYQGIRPAPGYPACPDHTEKTGLFSLLNVAERVGITLTDSLAMFPAASVSGWYFAHPQAMYFGLGKIGNDQVEDLAKRKGFSVETMERWLSSVMH